MSRAAARTRSPAPARTTGPRPPPGLPAWAAPLAYAFIVLILFREFFFQGALLLGSDTYALSYFARNFYTTFVHEMGRFPQWNPLLFGGIPFIEGMHGDIFYPPSLALFFMDARTMWGWKMVLHIYLAGLLCYLWLRSIGLGRGAAFFGGLVFMLGADLVSLLTPGGDGKLFVSALAPLMFWLAERCVRGRRPADFALFALGMALVVFTSHMQLAYFTVWGVSLYFLFRVAQVWRSGRSAATAVRLVGGFAIAGVLGVGAAAVQFVPPLDYLRSWSHRAAQTVQAEAESGYAFSTTYSLHPEEIVSLIVPEFVGDNVPTETRSGQTYWGRNPFKINSEYAGLVPLLLVPVLFLRRRQAETWFFTALAVLSLLYALGATTPVFRLFYMVPGVDLFRAPSLIIFLYGLSVATLGAMAVQRLLDWATTADAHVPVRRTLWTLAVIFLLLALAQSANLITNAWQRVVMLDAGQAAALQRNLEAIRTGFWISFVLAASVAGIWEVLARGWLGPRAAVLVLALFATIDLYRVDRPFIRNPMLEGQFRMARDPTLFEPDRVIRFLQQTANGAPPFRAHDLGTLLGQPTYGSNVLAAHGIEQLTGHHGNEIGRYRELMGGADSAPNVAVSELRLLDFVNVEYLVSPQRVEWPTFQEVFASERAVVYRNTRALPRAWLVGSVEIVPDDQAVAGMLAPDFTPGSTAFLPEPVPAGLPLEPEPQGDVTWVRRELDDYTLRVRTDRPALLVIAENWLPAWHAEVDGSPTPLLRANYTFRAVPLSAGQHDVRLYYHSETVRATATASIVVLLLLLAVALTGIRQGSGGAGRDA